LAKIYDERIIAVSLTDVMRQSCFSGVAKGVRCKYLRQAKLWRAGWGGIRSRLLFAARQ